jgi:hypothetical protein
MEHYARIIQECQHDLGLEVSSFDNIGMPASSFLWQITQENNNQEEQEVSDKEYQTEHQYEQERFTDTYHEDFRDDENKDDRFNDNACREDFTD